MVAATAAAAAAADVVTMFCGWPLEWSADGLLLLLLVDWVVLAAH